MDEGPLLARVRPVGDRWPALFGFRPVLTRYFQSRRTASGRAMVDGGRSLPSGMNARANPISSIAPRPEQFINGRQLLGSQSRSDGCGIHGI
jgi:hypothetical protein